MEKKELLLYTCLILCLNSFVFFPSYAQVFETRRLIHSIGAISYYPEPNNMSKLHVEGKYVKNSEGDIILLKGINYGAFIWSELANWTGDSKIEYNKQQIETMKDWGFNVVRLNFIESLWSVQKDLILQTVRWCKEYGLYVILDMHYWTPDGWETEFAPPDWQQWRDAWKAHVQWIDEENLTDSVLIGLWNEPHKPLSWEVYAKEVQKCVEVIREVDNEIIIVVDAWDCDNLFFVEQDDYRINDSNIIYSPHLYRNNLLDIPYELETLRNFIETNYGWTSAQSYAPILIGEFNAKALEDNQYTSEELIWLDNFLKLLKEWEIGFCAWTWATHPNPWGVLLDDNQWSNPTLAGEVIKNYT